MKKTDKISEIWTAIDMMGAGDKIEIEKFSDYVVIEKVPRGKMFDRDDRESISYQCEENKIYKEGFKIIRLWKKKNNVKLHV